MCLVLAGNYNNKINNFSIDLGNCAFCSSSDELRYWNNVDFPGNALSDNKVSSFESCMELCLANASCNAFTYDNFNRFSHVNCWLKTQSSKLNMKLDGLTSGMRCNVTPIEEPSRSPDAKYPISTYQNFY